MKKLFALFLVMLLCGCSGSIENTFLTITSYKQQHADTYKETYMPHHYLNNNYTLTSLTEEENITIYCVDEQKHIYHMLFNVEGITIAYWFNYSDQMDYRYFIEQGQYRYYYIKEDNYVSVMYSDEQLDMCIDFSEYEDIGLNQDELIQLGIDILNDTIILNK